MKDSQQNQGFFLNRLLPDAVGIVTKICINMIYYEEKKTTKNKYFE